MPPRTARLAAVPKAPPEWQLLKELKDDVLKSHWAGISTSSSSPASKAKKASKSRGNNIAMDLNREIRQVLTMTDWSHLEAALDPEEPTENDRSRRRSFYEASVQVCKFLDGLVDSDLSRKARFGTAGRASSRYRNLKSLYTSLQRPNRKIECLTMSREVISIFKIKNCEKSRLERGLKDLKTFNSLVGELQALDPLPLPIPGNMPITLEHETVEKFTRHTTLSLKAIFRCFCSNKVAHKVLVELPTVSDLAKETSTLSLLMSLCSVGNDRWQEAEIQEGPEEEEDVQFIKAHLISLADLLLAIELGSYYGSPVSKSAQLPDWNSLRFKLADKAAEERDRATQEGLDKIPYFSAVMACLLFETAVGADIDVSDGCYLDPRIPKYIREKILGNLLQSIDSTKRTTVPSANKPKRGRSTLLAGGSRDTCSIVDATVTETNREGFHHQKQLPSRFGQKPSSGGEKKVQFTLPGDARAPSPYTRSLPTRFCKAGDSLSLSSGRGEEEPESQQPRLQDRTHLNTVFDGGTCNLAGDERSVTTDDWFKKLEDVHTNLNRDRMDELQPDEVDELIKVAVLDTGADLNHEAFEKFRDNGQLDEGFNFVESGKPMVDLDGHGTHCCDLIFKTAPYARVYPLRVFRSNSREDTTPELIKDAIHYATETLDVDIISMSFSFEEEEPEIKEALYNAKRKSNKPFLMFAAASNNRALRREPIGYPARANDRVICVNSSTVQDEKSSFSPTGGNGRANLSVVGENVLAAWPASTKEPWKRMSGTSCATPIVAGVAALILDFSQKDLPVFQSSHRWDVEKKGLWETVGMRSVLKRCLTDCKDNGTYNFLKPWKLLSQEEDTIVPLIREALCYKHKYGL
ncbi:hypothetical protein IL306_005886 [Fusarium sp. DS 682]|nr:hypothetical protein IL306_005886 [Fusarium sp. DS 682]